MALEPIDDARAWGEATARELIAVRLARGGRGGDHPNALRWQELVESTLEEQHPARVASLLAALAELGADGVEAGEWLPKRPRLATRPPAPAPAPPVQADPTPPRRRFSTFGRIAAALVVGLLLKTFVVQVYAIPSSSMEPTLSPGERLAVDKITFRLTGVDRGDVVVFRAPAPGITPHDTLVKRAVAVGGDTVAAIDGVLLVNGEVADEPYLADGEVTFDFDALVVPDGHLFVMGDHRVESVDSRSFGPIDEDLVIGRPAVRLWPLGDIGPL